MERLTALIGFFAILLIAYLMSNNKKAIKWRPVIWGLVLQIVIAVFVLKGIEIANAMSALALPLTRGGAALVFVLVAIVTGFLAGRVAPSARKALWIAFGIISLYLFLTYNLLAFVFENMKGVVNRLIGSPSAASCSGCAAAGSTSRIAMPSCSCTRPSSRRPRTSSRKGLSCTGLNNARSRPS